MLTKRSQAFRVVSFHAWSSPEDHGVIFRARRPLPPLTYQHVDVDHESLLWLPDSFAWLVGARGDWLRRVEPAITRRVDVG